ncbi:MAG TPA: hypothetical protein VK211_15500 [Kamptonema sp.]|nr:hypothetical protein [Kamptonema sp.]
MAVYHDISIYLPELIVFRFRMLRFWVRSLMVTALQSINQVSGEQLNRTYTKNP